LSTLQAYTRIQAGPVSLISRFRETNETNKSYLISMHENI